MTVTRFRRRALASAPPESRRYMRRRRGPSHATIVAYLALFVAMSGTAVAATGGSFILGRGNTATSVTGLANTSGTPLSLAARSGYAPLRVNSKVQVPNLNSNYLGGLTAGQFQRKLSDVRFLNGMPCNTGQIGEGHVVLNSGGGPRVYPEPQAGPDITWSCKPNKSFQFVLQLDSATPGDVIVAITGQSGKVTQPLNLYSASNPPQTVYAGYIPAGETITLTASQPERLDSSTGDYVPVDGQWSGACTGSYSTPCTLNFNADRSVTFTVGS